MLKVDAMIHLWHGASADAIRLGERAVAMGKRCWDLDHPFVATAELIVTGALLRVHDVPSVHEAAKRLPRIVDVLRSSDGDHPMLAIALHQQAKAAHARGQDELAEQLAHDSFELYRCTYPVKGLTFGRTLVEILLARNPGSTTRSCSRTCWSRWKVARGAQSFAGRWRRRSSRPVTSAPHCRGSSERATHPNRTTSGGIGTSRSPTFRACCTIARVRDDLRVSGRLRCGRRRCRSRRLRGGTCRSPTRRSRARADRQPRLRRRDVVQPGDRRCREGASRQGARCARRRDGQRRRCDGDPVPATQREQGAGGALDAGAVGQAALSRRDADAAHGDARTSRCARARSRGCTSKRSASAMRSAR